MLKKFSAFYRAKQWHKLLTIFIAFILVIVIIMYGVAEWYIQTEASQQLQLGVSFIPDYASSLGLNPDQTFTSLIGLSIKHFRLVSYWSDMEPAPGQYNFSQLDTEFNQAKAAHAKISLSLGLRQPRWPECHAPNWVNISSSETNWQPQLESFIQAVVNRYKDSPALESYQLENEYFLKGFGNCPNMDRSRLVSEFNLVKHLDNHHPVIIARSNNSVGFPTGQPKADEYGISIYKRVWDANVTHRYLEYPYPAWYYAFLAGAQKILTGKDMIIHEMQAEAWAPNNKSITQIGLSEQNKSLNAKRLSDRFNFAKATGIRQIYMWGGEYWYYRLVVLHDSSLWNVAKQQFQAVNKTKP